ncbi:ABC transporter substrate-binding protein [Litchfieldella xinjiangensis]|uniref:ABC transporter substrate-binding protein n=1 Tax=Litchfieldella xinjiangensis TaxID=1166948 RepID=UPI0005BE5773|nr:ABC transporter substrate-binding protein [Halomonas xinjiangensis]
MKRCKSLIVASLVVLPLHAQAAPTDTASEVRFVVPPWPGVTVKTEILAQILAPLGYDNDRQEVSSTVGYSALKNGESDVFLAGWMPSQKASYDATMASGAIVDMGNNVNGAQMGFAVPGYVHEAGITSAEQLDQPEYRERFDTRYYSIESGSTVSDTINDAVDNDVYGLGDWNIVESSTPGMLGEVEAASREGRWIAFYGWTPHWMAIKYDMHILDDPAGVYGENNGRSDIRTIVNKQFSEDNPNLSQLLDQFVLTAEDQSEFIQGYGLEDRDADVVAKEWLQANPDKLASFLEGVTTKEGEPGLDAVKASLQ